jgi:hypothetical protein
MKKNKVFWSMLGLSAAIHALMMIGVESGFHTSSPVLENQFVSTIKIIQVAITPQREAPSTPNIPVEKKGCRKTARNSSGTFPCARSDPQ